MPPKKLKGFEEFTPEELKKMAFDDDDIVFDEDNPEWTAERIASASSVADLPTDLHAKILSAFPKTRLRGPQKAPTKVPVSLRLSSDVVDHFKAGGRGWQTRMEAALRDSMKKAG